MLFDELFLTELFVLATNRCNLSCRHCYVSSGPTGHRGLELPQLIGAATDFHALFGRQRLSLSGGEFFMRKDLVEGLETLAALHDLFILTNGMLLSEEVARRMKGLRVALRFGIDGATSKTHDWMRGRGSFEKMQRGLRLLLAAGVSPNRLEIFFTATPENLHEVPGVLAMADKFGIKRFLVEPVAVHGRAEEHWPKTRAGGVDPFRRAFHEAIRLLHETPQSSDWQSRPVQVAFTSPTVYFDGRVYPFTPADALDEEMGLLGNINDLPLREMLDASTYRQKALVKAMRHMKSAVSTTGPRRFWRNGHGDATCFA